MRAVVASPPHPQLPRYWAIRGLGAPLRMMVTYAGAAAEFKCYACTPLEGGGWDRACWIADAKPAIRAANPLANLPYIQAGDDTICQSNACLTYLARRFGLYGTTWREQIGCEELLDEAMDLRNACVRVFYGSGVAGAEELLQGTVATSFTKFEQWLQRSPLAGTFLLGAAPRAPDFHLWELIDQLESFATDAGSQSPSAQHPKLSAFYAAFRALPQLQPYFAGPHARLPANNRMAKWGADGEVDGQRV